MSLSSLATINERILPRMHVLFSSHGIPVPHWFLTMMWTQCERCDFAYHQPALVAELSAHQPGIWHLLTSDDILETAETLNRCQSQIWYWIQKYKEIRRHSKSKESERDPKRNGTRLETLLASLGVSWRLESRLRSDDPFHILVQVLPLKLDLKALRNSSTKLKTVVKHKVVKL